MPIEDWISAPIAASRHVEIAPLEAEPAFRRLLAVDPAGDPVGGLLLRVRGLRFPPTLERAFSTPPFLVLGRAETELVVGLAGAVWRPRGGARRAADGAEWSSWDEPGTVRVAATLGAEALEPGRSLLVTETAIEAVDGDARRAFLRYWRLVGPFSSLLRRRWLRAAAREPVRT